jgi:hypothetical protein
MLKFCQPGGYPVSGVPEIARPARVRPGNARWTRYQDGSTANPVYPVIRGVSGPLPRATDGKEFRRRGLLRGSGG